MLRTGASRATPVIWPIGFRHIPRRGTRFAGSCVRDTASASWIIDGAMRDILAGRLGWAKTKTKSPLLGGAGRIQRPPSKLEWKRDMVKSGGQ
jgi:hypothetical protein